VNLVSIEKKRVGDIYLPLENTLCIDKDQNPKEVEKTIISSGHTRIPVRQGNEMIGLLNTKEFFAHQTSPLHQSWQSLIRPIVRIDEKAPLVKALRTMQERRSHLSLVYRNHQLLGIVTMEDIFEEVIGDIYDEDDFPNYERSV
jgi:putative hemolysin